MHEIVIKPADVQTFMIALASLLTAAGVIGGYISRLWQRVKKPETEQDTRLKAHEARLDDHEKRLSDLAREMSVYKTKQKDAAKSERAMQKVLLALVDYEIDKSETSRKNLEDARNTLRDYLVEK